MTEYMCLISIILMQVLCSLAQDASSSVTFNEDLLTWSSAVNYCTRDGGKLLLFRSVINIHEYTDKLGLTSEINVWIADYLQWGSISYCGFSYLTNESYLDQEVFYGDCNATRNYFCMLKKGLVVYNGTRDRVICTYPVSNQYLEKNKAFIKSGFYWTTESKFGTEVEGTGVSDAILCGAYRRSIGKYYVDCNSYRNFYCEHTGQITKRRTDQTTFVTNTEGLVTRSSKASTTDQPITAVTTTVKNKSSELTGENMLSKENIQEKEKSTDVGIKVGIPVGIVLPVVLGVAIVIYIYRKRFHCWQKERIDHIHTQEPSQIHVQTNDYSESGKGITPMSPDNNAENVVVMKPKKDTRSSKLEKYSDKTYNNVAYDEYDTTSNFQSGFSNSSNNIYNHLETDDYNRTIIPTRQGERNNVYDSTTHGNLVDSNYDSTTQVNGATESGDMYNHLSQNENNYDSTTQVNGTTESGDMYNHLSQNENNYDSTTQVNGTTESGDMYNHLSQNENNYDSTTQVNGTTESDDMYNHLSQSENNYDSTTQVNGSTESDDMYNNSTSNTRNIR